MVNKEEPAKGWRKKIYQVIFEADTPSGKYFDVLLIWTILLSLIVVSLDSISSIKSEYGKVLLFMEWLFTVIFTIEYIFRIICLKKPKSYILSFYGIIDLLAIIPSYLSLFIVGAHSLMVIRTIRLLRIFRLFKLARYVGETEILLRALRSGKQKIIVFLLAVMTIAIFMGALMYVVEGKESGFTSIPKGIYWAIVTMTTVGYGDLVPLTNLGKFLASILMIMGYGIIAVPTGIFSVEIANASRNMTTKKCPNCMIEGLALESKFCQACGAKF